jgi:hypothetical protein
LCDHITANRATYIEPITAIRLRITLEGRFNRGTKGPIEKPSQNSTSSEIQIA